MLKTAYAIGQLEALESFGLEKVAVNARLLGTLAGSALGSMAAPEGEGLQGAILGGAGGYLSGAGLSHLGQAGGKALEGAKNLYNKSTGITGFQNTMDDITNVTRKFKPKTVQTLARGAAAQRGAKTRAMNAGTAQAPTAPPPGLLERAENWIGEKAIDPMINFLTPPAQQPQAPAAKPRYSTPAKKPSNAAPPAKKKPSNAAPQSQKATGTNP